ncbi:MAG: cyclophilin family peptidyl-prolyl cis-trans isomerase [Halioglobus sp.]|jgi:cyclophilin family peptidyl-prolyl cis-trans isomerase
MRILAVIGLLGLLIGCGDSQQPVESELVSEESVNSMVDKTHVNWKSDVTEPEMMPFEPSKTYVWELETNLGTMTFSLFHNESPKHVNSTVYLTELGFYDDLIFHRVIPGFMAQGGDPTGTGRGGPAYKYDGEFAPGLSHTKPGLLSMANAGPGTDGSQFFITFVPTPFLDGKHTIFGELISGAEVLSALEARGSRGGKTSEMLKIIQAKILVE